MHNLLKNQRLKIFGAVHILLSLIRSRQPGDSVPYGVDATSDDEQVDTVPRLWSA